MHLKSCRNSFALFLALFLLPMSQALAQKNTDAGVQVYDIIGGQSDIHVLVYKAGALGALGHNHVVSVGNLKGKIHLSTPREKSRFDFSIAVGRLIVDPARLRRQEGKAFASKPSKSDIAGTRKNMLSSKLLNGSKYSTIQVKGTGGPKTGTKSGTLKVSVKILGRRKSLNLPVALNLKGDTLIASGSRKLSHRELGLKPFSALFGALKVADGMRLKYRVVARLKK